MSERVNAEECAAAVDALLAVGVAARHERTSQGTHMVALDPRVALGLADRLRKSEW